MGSLPNPLHPSFLERLDADFIEYYNQYLAVKPATHTVSISDIRAAPKLYAMPWYKDFSYESFVNDIKIKSDDGHMFTARCYQPDARTSPFGAGPYPVYINFHGGGYTFGDLTGDAELCMLIRDRVGILVMDVDYRLAPENTMYRGHDDAWAAIRWVTEHGKEINGMPGSISIGGISAGGHICAVAQQLARDASLDLKLAILAVPATIPLADGKTPADVPYPSYVQNELAPSLNWKRLAFFRDTNAGRDEAEKTEIANRPEFMQRPINGNLKGVCNTFIATADCDPLRDEGEAYGQELIKAGVRVTTRRYMGVPHPFMHMLVIEKAKLYMDDICAQLRAAHGAW